MENKPRLFYMLKPRRIVPALLACAIAVGCGSGETDTSAPTSTTASKSGADKPTDENAMAQSNYKTVEIYTDLRNQLLQLKPDFFGLKDAEPSRVIAVLMETGYPEAVATLVAASDGAASIYFSNGGGIIGGGEHEPARDVAKAFIASAQKYAPKTSLTEKFPLPRQGHVRFYLVTAGGVYTIEAVEEDLGNQRHPFSPLFYKGHELVTAIREHVPE